MVRDLSNSLGKQVQLVMEGKETELDRSLLEAVKDPLTHLVRNAVDHGIEEPERAGGRQARGGHADAARLPRGRARRIEVADDGAGIDVQRIAEKAIEKGLISRRQIATMDKRDIMALVFQPGFSTATKVTNVSGRGVGMDVVKTNIERIGGAVDVDSTLGEGTVCRLTIPLTLAIIQALTVDCGDQRYVVPQVSVLELVVFRRPIHQDRVRLRRARLPAARQAAPAGPPGRALGLECGRDAGGARTRASTSWCCRPRSRRSASSWTGS